MGNANSRQMITQPFQNAASFLMRRTHIWVKLQVLVQRIKDVVGSGQKPVDESQTVPSLAVQDETPPPAPLQQSEEPHGQDEFCTGCSDTSGASEAESHKSDVPDQQPSDQDTSEDKQDTSEDNQDTSEDKQDTSKDNEPNGGCGTGENESPSKNETEPDDQDVTNKEDIRVGNITMTLGNAMPRPLLNLGAVNRKSYTSRVEELDAVYSRLAPESGRPSKPQTDTGATTNNDQDQIDKYVDNQVAEYVFSSLAVALPEPQYSRRGTGLLFQSPVDKESKENNIVHTRANVGLTGAPASTATSGGIWEPGATNVNYCKWDPRFYSKLCLDRYSIRLVSILPGSSEDGVSIRIDVHPLNKVAMKYEALSYVWGNSEPKRQISANEVDVPINPNLFDALVSLRQPSSERCIWIDAVCLNQKSIPEKSKEISKMGQIYSRAKTVIVFLGAPSPSQPTSIESFLKFLNRDDGDKASIRYAKEGIRGLDRICEKCQINLPDVCKGFAEACLQPWWGRIWTLQEFYLAEEEPIWYWGRMHASNGSLKRDFSLLMNLLRDLFRSENSKGRPLSDLKMTMTKDVGSFKVDLKRIRGLISRRYKTDGFDTPWRLYRELTAQASNPHDFVYGLRAIFDPVFGKVFVPDYLMPKELLFACLAVFLVHFERWGDVLWWYPSRFAAGKDLFPSWLPDFTQHIVPHELDVQPLDQAVVENPEPKFLVLNHCLHADGYNLDKIYGHRHLDNYDIPMIFQELWQFDHCMNNNHECHELFAKGAAPEDLWLGVFLEMYGSFYSKWTHFNSAFRGRVLQSTMKQEDHDKLPHQVTECMPCWDALQWHALRTPTPGLLEALGHDINDRRPGSLENIFSSRMREVFREGFVDFFIGACVFDWNHLSIWLKRFPDATQWCKRNDRYWTEIHESLPDDTEKRAKAIADAYDGYAADIWPELMRVSWCYSFYYTFLAYVILLDCDDHAHLTSIILKLRESGNEFRKIYYSFNIDKIASAVPSVATRVSYCKTVFALFRGRYLLWTDGGFRGISCPGMATCCDKKSIVAIVDGLSFPLIVRDYDETTGEGWLAGCALIRGVDMLGRDTERATLPPDYKRGAKRKFKFR